MVEAQDARTHETTETLEGTRDANVRVNLNQHAFRGMNVDLKKSRLVKRGVEQGEQALKERTWSAMCTVWAEAPSLAPDG